MHMLRTYTVHCASFCFCCIYALCFVVFWCYQSLVNKDSDKNIGFQPSVKQWRRQRSGEIERQCVPEPRDATGNAQWPSVDRCVTGTTTSVVEEERSLCRGIIRQTCVWSHWISKQARDSGTQWRTLWTSHTLRQTDRQTDKQPMMLS